MKNKLSILTLTLLAAAGFSSSLVAADKTSAADKAPSKPAVSPASIVASDKEAKIKTLPFHGKIASVDKDKKTFTLEAKKGEGRTFTIGDSAKMMKGDSTDAATWDDLKVGEEVRGSYTKSDAGAMEVAKLKVGAKTEVKKEKTEKPEKAKKDTKS